MKKKIINGLIITILFAVVSVAVYSIISDTKDKYEPEEIGVGDDDNVDWDKYEEMYGDEYETDDVEMTGSALKGDVTVLDKGVEEVTYSRYAEYLDRGLTAVKTDKGNLVSFRYLGTDNENMSFDIYRNGKCIKENLTQSTCYLDETAENDKCVYSIKVRENGAIVEETDEVALLSENYFDIPIQRPEMMTMPDGSTCTYSANDATVADLDGDGEYEIILKWDPSNAQDNSNDGYTGNVYIDAYKMTGERLWRIDLGVNIRAGAHYTQMMVYDFDCDGKAEMILKTSDGTVDGAGRVIGDGYADYRNESGRILRGNEYLTLFDGLTGMALNTIYYEPARGSVASWGDDYGNRVDRFLACVAYLDGKTPSVVMCRGYYTRTVLVAYDVVDKRLVKKWTFDSNESEENRLYAGQGNHNLAVADIDLDGFDEIVYGQCAIDHNGKGLSTTNLGHGDAIHTGDFLPDRDGLEAWGCLEGTRGAALRDATTGEILFKVNDTNDTGRAVCGNFISGNATAEFISSADDNIYDGNGKIVGNFKDITSYAPNYAIYWDGDLEQEVLDRTVIDKYKKGRIFSADGVNYINGTKANASLVGDILGDWREEVIWPLKDNSVLRVYMTEEVTEYKIYTLMHDIQYRVQIAAQNVAYNQGAYTSFFLGTEFELPKKPDIWTSVKK